MNCPTCGVVTDDIAVQLEIADRWHLLEDFRAGESTNIYGVGVVKMVVPPPETEVDSYGEAIAQSISMVIEVDGRLFRKDGASSSYGGNTWEGACRQVKAKPRTVTVYDYV